MYQKKLQREEVTLDQGAALGSQEQSRDGPEITGPFLRLAPVAGGHDHRMNTHRTCTPDGYNGEKKHQTRPL